MPVILAIDDRQDNLLSLAALLKSSIPDCRVVTALSGREGIEKASDEKPDTILLDIHMPGMDGFEVCQILKSHPDTKHIPVVMLTAISTDLESRIKGLQMGADAFFTKPIERLELAAQVKAMLRIKYAEDLLRRESALLEQQVAERTAELVRQKNQLIAEIEERKRMEARLHQAQKMESIGSLAGGIAHDFNNILFPILGMSEMLLEDLPQESPEYLKVEQIYSAAGRARELVMQILSFSRQGEYKKLPVRIQQILKEVLKLAHSTIPSNIEISQNIQNECGKVMADPTQIHQIAMNLITNAYHAVQDNGGRISVELRERVMTSEEFADSFMLPSFMASNTISLTTKASLSMVSSLTSPSSMSSSSTSSTPKASGTMPSTPAASVPAASGKYAMLTVSDTGCGIAPDVMDKIFEPYFTTKEQGKGTGLGLAVVYGIVKQYSGEIRISSELGKGTRVDVFFPIMDMGESPDMTEALKELPFKTGAEKILLVDDEASVIRVETAMLERLGYKVTSCLSSFEALDTFRSNPDAFDLVLTDMTMPGLTGDQLASELISIKPSIPVIICTGFSEKVDAKAVDAMGIKGFLKKPVIMADLAQKVRDVLDEE
ncbi:hypothetical protein MTBBW1_190005 [Desulfamplus magnetovallimortis]|uniref:histidine kinase n=1 Tax=Desulfamplus magnetovallimortis TaxID=1246637 RepID=A0A1W1HB17_9BACT|nr:response regulator [Desulfamplus magnetovallimortis]SLM29633.1 hypothetical protein MTBBW1_190005 [Desulfamplus magnetovallimortis]